MKVYIVYFHFPDDPSVTRGIFSTEEKAKEAVERANQGIHPTWTYNYQEFELDEYLETELALN